MQGKKDPMHDETITVFNLKNGYWYPTIISGVHIETHTAADLTINGINNVGSVFISIPAAKNRTVKTSAGTKRFVRPKEYESSDPAECFTMTPDSDFIYEGEWRNIEADDDYDSGFYDEMNRTKDGIHLINAAEFLKLIPHIEVGAK